MRPLDLRKPLAVAGHEDPGDRRYQSAEVADALSTMPSGIGGEGHRLASFES